jgi:pimeloyl-ACP methyl ester carboxylesterase
VLQGTTVLVEDRNDNARHHYHYPGGGYAGAYSGLAQEAALSALQAPVLIVHGDADETERSLREVTRAGEAWLPEGSQVTLIRGADHSFQREFAEVLDLSALWLRRRFPASR